MKGNGRWKMEDGNEDGAGIVDGSAVAGGGGAVLSYWGLAIHQGSRKRERRFA